MVDGLASCAGPPVLLDLPGHGRHAGLVGAWRFTLEAVEAEVDALAGSEPLDLVGYSMGGRLALAYACRHPHRVGRLVLESASPGLRTEEERTARRLEDEALARRIEAGGIPAFVDEWEGLPLFASQASLPPEVRARQRAVRLGNHSDSLAAALRGLGTGVLPSYWGALATLPFPVLLVAGALDPKFVDIGRRMASALRHARLVEVPGVGHTVHLEQPGAWLAAVTGFLGEGRRG